MTTFLIFEAASGGVPFGWIELWRGLATARAGGEVLADVLLGHAVMWIHERNPRPHHPACIYISSASGHSGSSAGDATLAGPA